MFPDIHLSIYKNLLNFKFEIAILGRTGSKITGISHVERNTFRGRQASTASKKSKFLEIQRFKAAAEKLKN